MAFDGTETLNEIRIYDERNGEHQSLFARDPSPREKLGFEKEYVKQKGGKTQNHVARTRLKYGSLILDHPQGAATPKDEGYGFRNAAGEWTPLNPSLTEEQSNVNRAEIKADYAAAHGAEWAKFIDTLPPWVVWMLGRAPAHVQRVASVVFEGASDHKQQFAPNADDEEGDDEGN